MLRSFLFEEDEMMEGANQPEAYWSIVNNNGFGRKKGWDVI